MESGSQAAEPVWAEYRETSPQGTSKSKTGQGVRSGLLSNYEHKDCGVDCKAGSLSPEAVHGTWVSPAQGGLCLLCEAWGAAQCSGRGLLLGQALHVGGRRLEADARTQQERTARAHSPGCAGTFGEFPTFSLFTPTPHFLKYIYVVGCLLSCIFIAFRR